MSLSQIDCALNQLPFHQYQAITKIKILELKSIIEINLND